MSGTAWPDKMAKKLRKLWDEGHSCSEIARRLGNGVTRNAVIGKAARMGLPKRQQTSTSSRAGGRRAQQVLRDKAKLPPPPKPIPVVLGPEPVVPLKERRGVADLEAGQCRWPIGDPKSPDFHFCSYRKIPGKSYCLHHLLRSLPERFRDEVAAHYSKSTAPTVDPITRETEQV